MTNHPKPFDHNAVEIPGVTAPDDPNARDSWIRKQVQDALDDSRPAIPHERVMANMDAIIEEAVARRQARIGEAGAASE